MKYYTIRWVHKTCPILSYNQFGSNEYRVEAYTKLEAIKIAKECYLRELNGPRNMPPIKEVKFV